MSMAKSESLSAVPAVAAKERTVSLMSAVAKQLTASKGHNDLTINAIPPVLERPGPEQQWFAATHVAAAATSELLFLALL